MRTVLVAVIISAMAMLASCSRSKGSAAGQEGEDACARDSVEDAKAEASEATVAELPDTAYASALAVDYVVDTFSDADSCISDYKSLYASAPGVFTFRGDCLRNARYGGRLKGKPSEMRVEWVFHTSANKVWGGGTGWTGQPLLVHWPDSCMRRLRKSNAIYSEAGATEVISASLDGNVYFIDYATGKASRAPIMLDAPNPIKGTPSLDPTLNGNLYVGQGVPDTIPFGAFAVNLYENKVHSFANRDSRAWRGWQAYDSSPLRIGQFLFRPGENGTLYKYIVRPDTLMLHSTLRYRVAGAVPGIESSLCVYLNYGYFADNHGNVICVNLNSLRPVWHYALGDDTDATPVLDVEDGVPYIYLGCEIDRQGEGEARFAKLNGLTGEACWVNSTEGMRVDEDDKHFDGGYYSTCLLGEGNCSHLVLANCVLNTEGRNGVLKAINRSSGATVYETPLRCYAWSSPISMLNDEGEMYVVTGDCAGRLYIIEGATGEIIEWRQVGNNFESSPIAEGNCIVLGTRGNSIMKISIQ